MSPDEGLTDEQITIYLTKDLLNAADFERITRCSIGKYSDFEVTQTGVQPIPIPDHLLALLNEDAREQALNLLDCRLAFPCTLSQLIEFVAAAEWPEDFPDGYDKLIACSSQQKVSVADTVEAIPLQIEAATAQPATSNITGHSTTPTRTHALDAVISKAKETAADAADYHSVWAALVALAGNGKPPAPLIGFAEGEGVKYQGVNDVEFFTKNALRGKMNRAVKRLAR